MLVSCVKTSEAKETAKSNGEINFIFNVSSNESNLTVDVHHFILPGKFFSFVRFLDFRLLQDGWIQIRYIKHVDTFRN